jgi:hypothetical protein
LKQIIYLYGSKNKQPTTNNQQPTMSNMSYVTFFKIGNIITQLMKNGGIDAQTAASYSQGLMNCTDDGSGLLKALERLLQVVIEHQQTPTDTAKNTETIQHNAN